MMKIKGIKCDNTQCNYSDMDVKREDYEKYINRPCPLCGENLLTQKDYDTVVLLEKISNNFFIKLLNNFFSLFSKPNTYNVDMNGMGKVKFEKQDNP